MHKLLTLSSSLIVLFLAAASPVVSQDNCSSLMRYGIYDKYDVLSSNQDFQLLQSWLCDTNSSSYQKASQSAVSAGIDILDIVGLSGSDSGNESIADQKYHQFCTSNYSQLQTSTDVVQHVRSINTQLMAVVGQCINNQQSGFASWIETSQDRTTFSYFARYRPNGDEKAKIKSFDILPPEVAQACQQTSAYQLFKKNSTVSSAPIAMSCAVKPATTVTITLVSDKGGPNNNSFVSVLDGAKPDVTPQTLTKSYNVDAAGYSMAHQWLDTGLVLPAGTNLQITASGTAHLSPGDAGTGPNGLPAVDPSCSAWGITCGALYGRIGGGTMFFIGTSLTQQVAQAGDLFLSFGDTDWANNSGSFAVTVTATIPAAIAPQVAHEARGLRNEKNADKPVRVLDTIN